MLRYLRPIVALHVVSLINLYIVVLKKGSTELKVGTLPAHQYKFFLNGPISHLNPNGPITRSNSQISKEILK